MVSVILLAPLVGALICGFFWRLIGERTGQIISTGLLFLAAVLSWYVFLTFNGTTQHIELMRWVESGTLSTDWAIRLDRLTAIMLIVVTTVSALVHLYSFGYMAHDENWGHDEPYRARFFAYLSFFTFAMLALVTSDNLIQMFFGWEGVGVASYLLIGFYYRKPSAAAAAIKAFVVNRVGDFGFALGIFGLFYLTDSIKFDDVFAAAPTIGGETLHFLWGNWNAANVLGVLLFIGACGKSAQLFLHTWLPDAMEGPTPVSALIHAATMVTAGVFLVCRMSPLYEFAPDAKMFIVVIGASTAFFAATVGLVQNDIKRVIAYSTCSQLGYMFAAAGSGVYGVAMFHLLTHAFFKAMLFLGAGSVITAMHHEQDMRNYGGLRKKVPLTFWAMMIGTLAITGVGIPFSGEAFGVPIGFAGFLSKDAIIESTYAGGSIYGFTLLVVAAAFTSFYSWRLMFLTFYGEARGDHHAHDHAKESPLVMTIPLVVLAVGAVFAGMAWYNDFFGNVETMSHFFSLKEGAAPGAGAIYYGEANKVLETAHQSPAWVSLSPFVAMLLGFGVAYQFYIRKPYLPALWAENQAPLYRFLLNKWYFDELYEVIFVRAAKALGRLLWKRGDGDIIDGTLNGVAMGIVPFFTRLAGRAQSGYIFTYAFAMVLGIAVLITWMTIAGGTH
ncbi:NADH-quinone oxidoreductase subunit L [bacterium]|nr:NADH-quinone oxidoreductase subunit L [bacterium]